MLHYNRLAFVCVLAFGLDRVNGAIVVKSLLHAGMAGERRDRPVVF